MSPVALIDRVYGMSLGAYKSSHGYLLDFGCFEHIFRAAVTIDSAVLALVPGRTYAHS